MKNILESKTVWLNVIATALEITAVVEGVMPPQYLVYTTSAKAIINIVLRVWFTNKPLTEYASQRPE